MRNKFISIALSATICGAGAKQVASDAELIKMIKDDVKGSLKDPYSARFQDVFIKRDGKSAQIAVCGGVNAKNSFGGYVGSRRFFGVILYAPKIVSPRVSFSFVDQDDGEFDDAGFAHYCFGKPLPEQSTSPASDAE